MDESVESEGSGFPIQTSPYASPMHNFAGSIVLLTNPSDELRSLELGLRGLMEVGDEVKVVGTPLLNDRGVCSVISLVRSCVNQNTVLSNLDEMHIINLVLNMGDTLIKDLMFNKVEYGVCNPSARDRVHTMSITNAFVCMRRPFEEGERRFWRGSQQEIIMRNEGSSQKGGGGGLMKTLTGWGK